MGRAYSTDLAFVFRDAKIPTEVDYFQNEYVDPQIAQRIESLSQQFNALMDEFQRENILVRARLEQERGILIVFVTCVAEDRAAIHRRIRSALDKVWSDAAKH